MTLEDRRKALRNAVIFSSLTVGVALADVAILGLNSPVGDALLAFDIVPGFIAANSLLSLARGADVPAKL